MSKKERVDCSEKRVGDRRYRCFFDLTLMVIGGKWKPVILDRLAEHHISREDALLAVQTHGLMGAMDILGYVRQEVAQRKGTAKEVRNVPAYLAQCLREGYGLKSDAEREAAAAAAQALGARRTA